jgi:hypothetical protein
MPFAGNFHPEWGYLAPAPSFMRTARIVAVATAIGATAGAAVVLSLAGSSSTPGLQADTGRSLVVVHSLVQPAEAAPVVALQNSTPANVIAPVTVEAPSPAARTSVTPSMQTSMLPPGGSLMPLPAAAQVSAPLASEARTMSTPAVPSSVAALAEIPPATEASPAPAAGEATFAPDQTGTSKDGGKKQSRVADQAAQRGPQTAGAPAKKKPEEQRGLGSMLRHLFSARGGSSYYPN